MKVLGDFRFFSAAGWKMLRTLAYCCKQFESKNIVLVIRAEPDDALTAGSVSLAHQRHLNTLLGRIMLIDAYSIHPEKPWVDNMAEVQEQFKEILRHPKVTIFACHSAF